MGVANTHVEQFTADVAGIVSTTGGITGAGVNVTQAWLGNFEVETGAAIPTLTGAAGDYLDNTGAVTWAGIVALRTDPSGNRIMPHATQP